jgi:hypothetical protein
MSAEQLGSKALDVVIVQVHGQYDLQRRSLVFLSHFNSDESEAVYCLWSMT